MWVPYAVDRTLRPLPAEDLEGILQRDNCGPAAGAPIHCLMVMGAWMGYQAIIGAINPPEDIRPS